MSHEDNACHYTHTDFYQRLANPAVPAAYFSVVPLFDVASSKFLEALCANPETFSATDALMVAHGTRHAYHVVVGGKIVQVHEQFTNGAHGHAAHWFLRKQFSFRSTDVAQAHALRAQVDSYVGSLPLDMLVQGVQEEMRSVYPHTAIHPEIMNFYGTHFLKQR